MGFGYMSVEGRHSTAGDHRMIPACNAASIRRQMKPGAPATVHLSLPYGIL